MTDNTTDRLSANGMYVFRGNGLMDAPPKVPTHTAHTFNPDTDEPAHAYSRTVTHAPFAHVMETMVEPTDCHFQYMPGMYVYVHEHAMNTNPGDALECCIEDVTGAPLEIIVTPCNHPEQTFTARQDQLSAPIWV